MDGPCATELLAAEACVVADPATCSCFSQPFNETFPSEVGGAYRTTMAFEIPGSDMFCEVANENVCIKLEASGTCCCTKEVHEFITCSFTSDWNVQFAAGDCVFNKCSTADESEGSSGGSSMMIIIIAIVLTLLLCCCCCCCGCYFYRRRRNALATSAGESTSKDVSTNIQPTFSMHNFMESCNLFHFTIN